MKGSAFTTSKEFDLTFHRIVTAERKKLAKGSRGKRGIKDHEVTVDDIMRLPYIGRNYQPYNTYLGLMRSLITLEHSDLDIVKITQSVQFMRLLLTIQPNPVSRLMDDRVPEVIMELAVAAQHVYLQLSSDGHDSSDQDSNEQKKNDGKSHVVYHQLFMEISLFLAELTMVPCHRRAVGRPLDEHIWQCVATKLYPSILKKFVDVTTLDSSSITSTSLAQPPDEIAYICMYYIWTLKNILATSRLSQQALSKLGGGPLSLIIYLLVVASMHKCNCRNCSSDIYSLILVHGMELMKHIASLDTGTIHFLFSDSLQRYACVRMVKEVLVRCVAMKDVTTRAFEVMVELTDTKHGSTGMSDNFIEAILKLEFHLNLIAVFNDPASASRNIPAIYSLQELHLAMRIFGNMAAQSGTRGEKTLQVMIDADTIPWLFGILKGCPDVYLTKEACWILSNMCASTPLHTCQVVSCNNFEGFRHFLNCMAAPSETPAVRREAVWAVLNTCHRRPKFQHLLTRFPVSDALCRYCYLQMVQHGHALGDQVTYILDIFNHLLNKSTACSTSLSSTQKEQISNTMTFLALYVPSVQTKISKMFDTHFGMTWTDVEALD